MAKSVPRAIGVAWDRFHVLKTGQENLNLICEICGSPLSHCGDYLELDRDRCGQCGDLDRCAGRVWFGGTCEILRVNAIVDGKILFHVSEKHRDVDDVLPCRASIF